MKPFKNTSTTQDVAEYEDDRGDKWRVLKGQRIFQYFRMCGGGAYILYSSIPSCKGSLKSAHSTMVMHPSIDMHRGWPIYPKC